MGASETIYGTVQEGSIPAWMEVVFITTLLKRKFHNYLFGKIYRNQSPVD